MKLLLLPVLQAVCLRMLLLWSLLLSREPCASGCFIIKLVSYWLIFEVLTGSSAWWPLTIASGRQGDMAVSDKDRGWREFVKLRRG